MSRNSPAPDSLPQPFSAGQQSHPHMGQRYSQQQPSMHSMPQPSPPRLPGSTFLWGQPPQQESQHSHTPADASQVWSHLAGSQGVHGSGAQPGGFASLFPPGVGAASQGALPGLLDGQHPMDFEQLLGDPAVQQLLQAQSGGFDPSPAFQARPHTPSAVPSSQLPHAGVASARMQHAPLGSQEGSHRGASGQQGSRQSPGGRPRPGASPPPGFAAPAFPAEQHQQQQTHQLLGQPLQPRSSLPADHQQQQQHGQSGVPQDPQAQSVLLLQALQASPDLLPGLLSGGQDPAAASQLRSLILENICKNPAAWGLTGDNEEALPEAQQNVGSNGAPGPAADYPVHGPAAQADRLDSQSRGLSGQGFGSGFPDEPAPEPERSDVSLYEMLYGEHGGVSLSAVLLMADAWFSLLRSAQVSVHAHCRCNVHGN